MPFLTAGLFLAAPAAHTPLIRADASQTIATATPNPAQNISPDFYTLCNTDGANSSGCTQAILKETDAALIAQGGQPFTLPANYASLSQTQQLFLLTNLDRGAFHLSLATGLNATLDTDAQIGVTDGTDPTTSLPQSFQDIMWDSNWAENINPLAANFNWMFDDGPDSGNIDCTASDPNGCWGHRDNFLTEFHQTLLNYGWDTQDALAYSLIEGTGASPSTPTQYGSDTTMLMIAESPPALTYTWAQMLANYQGVSPWITSNSSEPTPSPTPSPAPSPAPSPTPSPTPSPAPSPAPTTPSAPSPTVGSLWRITNTDPVYIVTTSHTLYHIPSPLAFQDLHASWSAVNVESALPNLPGVTSMAIPTGSLWRVAHTHPVYMVTPQNMLYHIPNPTFFQAFNDRWNQVHIVNQLPSLTIASSFSS